MSLPSVSVIIPTYNREHTLRRALDSVLGQTFLPAEVMVVDDASTDGSAQLIKSYAPKVGLLSLEENRGVSFARNRGIEAARGEWIAFLDSDDEWLPHKLERQVQLMHERPDLKILHGEEIWIRRGVRVNPMKKHQKYGGHIFEHCLPLCVISPSAVIIHREVFELVGLFNEAFPVCEDYDLWLRATLAYEVGFIAAPIIRKFGGHSDQLSHAMPAMDYYRVKALALLLMTKQLDERQRFLVEETLGLKLAILEKGALKHGNASLLESLGQIRAMVAGKIFHS